MAETVPREIASAWLALIVDPDVEHLAFVARVLEDEGYGVRACMSGTEALKAATTVAPQLAIIEVDTGEICGYEVCRALREAFGDAISIMFLSGDRHERHDRVAGLLLGADDFIAKPVSRDELRARARVLTRRVQRTRDTTANDAEFGLTAREMEVLQLLADGLDQNTIAHRLFIASKTVGKHIEHILEKLSAHSRAEVVSIAHRHGLAQRRSAGATHTLRPARR
jgi:DNA-binding NarL/FixJ family response regulator